MKRVTTGLVGLGLAASVGFAYASPGVAQPTPDVARTGPGRQERRRSSAATRDEAAGLRETAITSVINGDAKPVTKNGTSVVKVGEGHSPADAAALANKKATTKQRQAARDASRGPVRRAQAGAVRQDLRDPRRVRQRAAPGLPRRGHRSERARADDVRGPAAQPDPRAGPHEGQLHGLAERLHRRALPGPLLRQGQQDRVGQDLLRGAVVRPLHRRRHGLGLGEGALQRGSLRPRRVVQDHLEPDPGRDHRVGGRPEGGRQDRRRDQGGHRVVRRVRPLRLRRRRQLQRVRRLHRPLPDRARRRRRGRRRSPAG